MELQLKVYIRVCQSQFPILPFFIWVLFLQPWCGVS